MAAARPPLGRAVPAGTHFRSNHRPLVGRQRELAEISRLAVGTRLLTLTGTGGIGKTRLAVELAQQTESQYADGAVIVDLAPVVGAAAVPDAVAAALGVGAKPGESATDRRAQASSAEADAAGVGQLRARRHGLRATGRCAHPYQLGPAIRRHQP